MSSESDINAAMLAMRRYAVAHKDDPRYWQGMAEQALLAGTKELEAKIARVREIHKPYSVPQKNRKGTPVATKQYCDGCGAISSDEYPVDWPCVTILALDDTDTVNKREGKAHRKRVREQRLARERQEERTKAAYARDGFNVTFVDNLEDA